MRACGLLLVAILLLCPVSVQAAIALVGSAVNAGIPIFPNFTIVVPYASGTGHTVVACLFLVDALQESIQGVTDTGGSVYTLQVSAAIDNGSTRLTGSCFSTPANGSIASTSVSGILAPLEVLPSLVVVVGEYSGAAALGSTATFSTITGTIGPVTILTQDTGNVIVGGLGNNAVNVMTATAGVIETQANTSNSGLTFVTGGLADNSSVPPANVTLSATQAGGTMTVAIALELRTLLGPSTCPPSLALLGAGC